MQAIQSNYNDTLPQFFLEKGKVIPDKLRNRIQKSEEPIAKSTDTIREVSRLPWKNIRLIRSNRAYRVSLFFEALGLGILYLFIHLFVDVASTVNGLGVLTTTRIYIFSAFVLLILLNMLVDIIDWLSKKYFLESSSYIYFNEFLDMRPGKLIIKKGVLFQKTKIYSMSEFVDVEYRQSIFGNFLFYGNIIIYMKNGEKVLLTKVSNPALFTKIIQQMIDHAQYEKFLEKN